MARGLSYSLDDTIAAISTPLGEGGIGIVRLSGPESAGILRRLFRPAGTRAAGGLPPRQLILGHIIDPASGQEVDEVLVSFMPAPHTYTRQDVVEINCHGGIVATRRVLELCLLAGARLAGPGEFTLRAFLNGRIDLAQAEAVLDIVRARTSAGLQVAVGQLSGALSARIRALRQRLMGVQAHVVASIDFPEDEIPQIDVGTELADIERELAHLLETADRGIIYRQGIRTAIIGRPNVGKSSLLNALLRTNRAIVTPIPGTTRDTVEETLNLQGIPLVLVDTAGLDHAPRDPIEELGMERSRAALALADLVLAVVDGSMPLQPQDQAILELLGERPALIVINKCDLPQALDEDALPAGRPRVHVSALTGQGLPELEDRILDMVLGGHVTPQNEAVVSSPRHKQALSAALESVRSARTSWAQGLPADCISIDLSEALDALGQITGETADEELLDRIFSEFCIGK
jgi:tRNA modification GTPase